MLLSFKINFCNDGEHEQLTSENNGKQNKLFQSFDF
jgi:hypothetical protein